MFDNSKCIWETPYNSEDAGYYQALSAMEKFPIKIDILQTHHDNSLYVKCNDVYLNLLTYPVCIQERQDLDGYTSFQVPCKLNGDLFLGQYLDQIKKEIKNCKKQCVTPLMTAKQIGHTDVVKELRKAGAIS
ncbi:unnamed protein product, partial [Meganyctiphanes norvegica]